MKIVQSNLLKVASSHDYKRRVIVDMTEKEYEDFTLKLKLKDQYINNLKLRKAVDEVFKEEYLCEYPDFRKIGNDK